MTIFMVWIIYSSEIFIVLCILVCAYFKKASDYLFLFNASKVLQTVKITYLVFFKMTCFFFVLKLSGFVCIFFPSLSLN